MDTGLIIYQTFFVYHHLKDDRPGR